MNLEKFEWKVASSGYNFCTSSFNKDGDWEASVSLDDSLTWDDVDVGDEYTIIMLKELVPIDGVECGDYRIIKPFQDKQGLFNQFEKTEISVTGVKKFVDTYGLLTDGVVNDLRGMITNIIALRCLLRVYEAIKKNDRSWLLDQIQIKEADKIGKFVQFNFSPLSRSEAHRLEEINLHLYYPHIEKNSVHYGGLIFSVRPELEWLLSDLSNNIFQISNLYLAKLISRWMNNNSSYLKTSLTWNKKFGFVQEPTDLISGIWLQFAYYAMGNKELRVCENPRCDNYLIPKPISKKFCSDKCRVRSHQLAKEES